MSTTYDGENIELSIVPDGSSVAVQMECEAIGISLSMRLTTDKARRMILILRSAIRDAEKAKKPFTVIEGGSDE